MKINILSLFFSLFCFLNSNLNAQKTIVEIKGDQFYINGKPTYEGRTWKGNKIEGLLMNARMVQGIFDDLNPETVSEFAYTDTKKWDANRNTNEFVAAMPVWYQHGLNAFTLNMQGGSPYGYGNKKCLNPGFNPDGSLMQPYMNRLDKILKKADELHMVVILGLFYFGQDQNVKDEKAVINAVDNMTNWLFEKGYRNVVIEINNECDHKAYDHAILRPDRVHELIERVKNKQKKGYRLLVSTSFTGKKVPSANVVKAADFLLIHGNGAKSPEQIQLLCDSTRKVEGYRPMPVVNNEDDHFDFDKAVNNMTVSLKNYVSWGYFDFRFPNETDYKEGYQSVPVDWGINSERKKGFFNLLKEVTGGQRISGKKGSPQIIETLEIDSVWAANRVSFAIQTVGNRQFIAYYDKNRMMTVASRQLDSKVWDKKTLPNKLHWDSHNYVVLAVDTEGYIHVSGNMHAIPLTYFKSTKPYDVQSITEVNFMTGENEKDVTYPNFFYDKDKKLYYTYRSGGSGNGNNFVNQFMPEQNKWVRYLSKPLFEGKLGTETRSSYYNVTKDKEGNFHYFWLWRWTPLVETCHQLSYATTSDLLHWKNAAGETVEFPFRPDNKKLIVDNAPTKGGMHNGRVKAIMTADNKPIVGYIKYDEKGFTQLYLARFKNGAWVSKKISDWDFRWKFIGGGDQMTEGGDFSFAGFSDEGLLVINWNTEKNQSGRYAIDPNTFEKVNKKVTLRPKMPKNIQERMTDNPKLSVMLQEDKSDTETGVRYVLKWETMPKSHSTHAPKVIPEYPRSALLLLRIEEK